MDLIITQIQLDCLHSQRWMGNVPVFEKRFHYLGWKLFDFVTTKIEIFVALDEGRVNGFNGAI